MEVGEEGHYDPVNLVFKSYLEPSVKLSAKFYILFLLHQYSTLVLCCALLSFVFVLFQPKSAF